MGRIVSAFVICYLNKNIYNQYLPVATHFLKKIYICITNFIPNLNFCFVYFDA